MKKIVYILIGFSVYCYASLYFERINNGEEFDKEHDTRICCEIAVSNAVLELQDTYNRLSKCNRQCRCAFDCGCRGPCKCKCTCYGACTCGGKCECSGNCQNAAN